MAAEPSDCIARGVRDSLARLQAPGARGGMFGITDRDVVYKPRKKAVGENKTVEESHFAALSLTVAI